MLSLIIFSENGPTGDVFAVIFGQDDKDKDTFLLSNVVIGTGSFIVKPSLEGEWMGMRLLKTGEPFLPAAFVNQPFLPKVFPSTVCIFNKIIEKHLHITYKIAAHGKL